MASARQKKKQQIQQRRRQQEQKEGEEEERRQAASAAEQVISPSSSTTSSVPDLVAASSSGTQIASASSAVGPSTSGEADTSAALGADEDTGQSDWRKEVPTAKPISPQAGEKSGEDSEEGRKPAAAAESPAHISLNESADADVEDNRGEGRASAEVRHSSFDRLVEGWEATISSAPAGVGEGAAGDRSSATEQPRPRVQIRPSTELPPYASRDRVALDGWRGGGMDDEEEDEDRLMLRPLLFSHARSSPLARTAALFDSEDEDERVGATSLHSSEGMRRSVSTPSPFRAAAAASSAGSLFGSGDGGAFSAFSHPTREQYGYGQQSAARSDPGFASAFDPVWSRAFARSSFASSAPPATGGEGRGGEMANETERAEDDDFLRAGMRSLVDSSSSRRSRFFPDIKALRRRRARSGRENPARPPSTSSSSVSPSVAGGSRGGVTAEDVEEDIKRQSSSEEEDEVDVGAAVGTEGIHRETGAGRIEPGVGIVLSYSIDEEKATQEFEMTREVIGSIPAAPTRHYESLGSEDIEEEIDEFAPRPASASSGQPLLPQSPSTTLRFRADSQESPTPIPSPSYQQFVDHADEFGRGDNHMAGGDSPRVPRQRTPMGLPPQPSSLHSTPPHSSVRARDIAVTPQPRFILPSKSPNVSNLSPSSHGSGSLSRNTLNTSSQTHASTLTSGTLSSDKTAASSADADREVREVMEATRIANRQRTRSSTGARPAGTGHAPSVDGSASIHSASTGGSSSAHPRAYMNLAASPGPLREGASLPVDRFFQGVSAGVGQIALTHSSSSNTSSAQTRGSGGSGQSVASNVSGLQGTPPSAARRSAAGPVHAASSARAGANGSPTTVSSQSAANTTSSSSTGSEQPPPRFVSYLDRKTPEGAVLVKTASPPRRSAAGGAAARIAQVESIDEEETEEGSSPSVGSEGYSKLEGEDQNHSAGLPRRKKTSKKKEKLKKWMIGGGGGGGGRARPPLSPIKIPATPPPPSAGESPASGGTTPLSHSPPRRIVDSLIDGDGRRVDAARPRVVRSRLPPVGPAASPGEQEGERRRGHGCMVLLSPSDAVVGTDDIVMTVPGDDGAQEVFTASSAVGVVSPEGGRHAVPAVGQYEGSAMIEPSTIEDTENIREEEAKSVSLATDGVAGISSKEAIKSAVVTPEKTLQSAPLPKYE